MDGIWSTGLGDDWRYALRRLGQSPSFTASIVLTLGLAIGVNSLLFAVVDAVLLRPLPVAAPEELTRIYTATPGGFLAHGPMAFPDVEDLRRSSRSLTSVAAYAVTPLAFSKDAGSELVYGELVTGDYFETLGLRPAAGRLIDVADDAAGGARPVAVLSHETWQRRFGSAPDTVGRTIRLGALAFQVVGVAPPEFRGLTRGLAPELWIPMGMAARLPEGVAVGFDEATPGVGRLEDRSRRWVWGVGRRAPGASPERLAAELEILAARLSREYPRTHASRSFAAVPAGGVQILPGVDRALRGVSGILWGLVLLVLSVAGINVAGLLLARAVDRRREVATRLALGAGRGRIVRQLLVESLCLALLGGALGLLLARLSTALLEAVELPAQWPVPVDLGLEVNAGTVLFTFLVAAVAAAIFGLAPALATSRVDLARSLRSGSSSSGDRSWGRWRGGLVVAQVSLSLVLLIGTGLALRSLSAAQRIDPGFEPVGVVLASFAPELAKLSPARAESFFDRLVERVTDQPGVVSAGTASHLPLRFAIQLTRVVPEGLASPGEPAGGATTGGAWVDVDAAVVGPGYFETLKIAVVEGRAFGESDRRDAPAVVVINETLASRLWPGEEAVGRRLRVADGNRAYRVAGVVGDGKYRTLGESPRPFIYRAFAQHPSGTRTLVARIEIAPEAALTSIHRIAGEVESTVPVSGLETYEQALGGVLLLPRTIAAMLAFFGGLGLILTAVGIYGVVAHAGGRRSHEMGVRRALGATRGDVLRRIVSGGLVLTGFGLVPGLLLAWLAARVLEAVLYGVRPGDPLTFAAVPLVFLGIAFLAALPPALRAARKDPFEVLRPD